MRSQRAVMIIVFAVAARVIATPLQCTTGSLDSYVILGSSGCTIGNTLFSDFAVSDKVGWGNIDFRQVQVVPTDNPMNPQIQFVSPFLAQAGTPCSPWNCPAVSNYISLSVGYRVSPGTASARITRIDLWGDVFVNGFGVAEVDETWNSDRAESGFLKAVMDTTIPELGQVYKPSDGSKTTPAGSMAMSFDMYSYAIYGIPGDFSPPPGGSVAAAQAVTNSFREIAVANNPEPTTSALVGLGLFVTVFVCRRCAQRAAARNDERRCLDNPRARSGIPRRGDPARRNP